MKIQAGPQNTQMGTAMEFQVRPHTQCRSKLGLLWLLLVVAILVRVLLVLVVALVNNNMAPTARIFGTTKGTSHNNNPK